MGVNISVVRCPIKSCSGFNINKSWKSYETCITKFGQYPFQKFQLSKQINIMRPISVS